MIPSKKVLLALSMYYEHYGVSTVYRNILELIHYLSLMGTMYGALAPNINKKNSILLFIFFRSSYHVIIKGNTTHITMFVLMQQYTCLHRFLCVCFLSIACHIGKFYEVDHLVCKWLNQYCEKHKSVSSRQKIYDSHHKLIYPYVIPLF